MFDEGKGHQMLAGMQSKKNPHSLLVGMQNDAVTLEDSLADSYKTKYTFAIWSSICSPWYLPKSVEKLYPHKTYT